MHDLAALKDTVEKKKSSPKAASTGLDDKQVSQIHELLFAMFLHLFSHCFESHQVAPHASLLIRQRTSQLIAQACTELQSAAEILRKSDGEFAQALKSERWRSRKFTV